MFFNKHTKSILKNETAGSIIVMKECYRLPDHSGFFFHSNGGGKQKVGHKRLELSYAEKRYKMAK